MQYLQGDIKIYLKKRKVWSVFLLVALEREFDNQKVQINEAEPQIIYISFIEHNTGCLHYPQCIHLISSLVNNYDISQCSSLWSLKTFHTTFLFSVAASLFAISQHSSWISFSCLWKISPSGWTLHYSLSSLFFSWIYRSKTKILCTNMLLWNYDWIRIYYRQHEIFWDKAYLVQNGFAQSGITEGL